MDRRSGGRRAAVVALHPDLSNGPPGGVSRRGRGGAPGPQSGCPGAHAKGGGQAAKKKEVEAWTDEQVARFLAVSADHRWAVAFRLGVLYGLRRSEALALKWNDLDTAKGTLRIDEGLVAVRTGAAWSRAKNARSRRVIPLDTETVRVLARHRKAQARERLIAGPKWEDHDLLNRHARRPAGNASQPGPGT